MLPFVADNPNSPNKPNGPNKDKPPPKAQGPASVSIGSAPMAPENPLPGGEDSLPKDYQRASHELLYESIMHSGGEPFGNALGPGVTTLTNKTVKRFRKRGHFLFSTYEAFDERRRNRFTRAGATTNQKEYTPEQIEYALDPSKRPKPKWWQRFFGLKL